MFVRRDDSAIEKKTILIFIAAHSCVLVLHFSCVKKEKNVLLFLNGEDINFLWEKVGTYDSSLSKKSAERTFTNTAFSSHLRPQFLRLSREKSIGPNCLLFIVLEVCLQS